MVDRLPDGWPMSIVTGPTEGHEHFTGPSPAICSVAAGVRAHHADPAVAFDSIQDDVVDLFFLHELGQHSSRSTIPGTGP